MDKKTIFAVIALVLGGLAIIPSSVFAYQGDPSIKGPNYSAERHEAIEKAFNNNDYNAWKEQMQGRGRVIEVINKSNFSRFAQAHKLAEEGKISEANKIRQELGLGLGGRKGNASNQTHR